MFDKFDEFKDRLWRLKFKAQTDPRFHIAGVLIIVYGTGCAAMYVAMPKYRGGHVLHLTKKMVKELKGKEKEFIRFVGKNEEYLVYFVDPKIP